MAKQRIDAIIIQKIATLAEWNNIGRVPEKGEFMLIQNTASQPVNLKIGDGNRAFTALPNFIQYDQAAYVAPVGNVLPVPPNNVGYSLLTEGSYNSGALVVPTGNLGKAEYIGNAWVLTNMPLPTADVSNKLDRGGYTGTAQQILDSTADVTVSTEIIDYGNIKSFPIPLNSQRINASGAIADSTTLTYSNPMSIQEGDEITFSYPVRFITAYKNGVASLADGGGDTGSAYPSTTGISSYVGRTGVTTFVVSVLKTAEPNLVVNLKRTEVVKTLGSDVKIPEEAILEAGDPVYRRKSDAITILDTDFAEEVDGEEQYIGNIVDFDTPPALYAMNADGIVSTSGTYVHTRNMPVQGGDRVTFNQANRYVTAFVGGTAVRALGAGMNGSSNPATDIREYVVPDTVTGIVASPQGNNAANFQVNQYRATRVQKFKFPAPVESISSTALYDVTNQSQIRPPEVSIAPKLYGVIGEQISVYLDSTIKYWRDYKGYSDAQINIATQIVMDRYSQVTVTGNISGNFARLANEYFEVINTINFDIVAGNISNTTAKSVLLIGSSTTGQGHFLNYILGTSATTNLTWVGTKKTYNTIVANRVNSEGRAGRTLGFYMTLQKGTTDHNPFMQPTGFYKYFGVTGFWSIVKGGTTSGSQYLGYGDYIARFGANGYLITPSTNDVMYDNTLGQFRLWNGTAWVNITEATLNFSFNFPKYLSTWGLSAPDIVHVLLGSNEFMTTSEIETETGFSGYKNQLDTLISSCKSANPNIKIISAISFSSGLQGEDGTFYQERRKRSNWVFSKRTIEAYANREAEGIYVLDYNATTDRKSAYSDTLKLPYTGYDSINRDRYTADPVHLSVNGYEKQLGVTFAGIIQYLRSI